MLIRHALREIRSTLGRYLAIMAIVALGVGFFSGLKIYKACMLENAEDYYTATRFHDFELQSTKGFDKENVKEIASAGDVKQAEGTLSTDALLRLDGGEEKVYTFHSLTKNVDKVHLTAGTMPKHSNECLADDRFYSKKDIGKTFRVTKKNSELRHRTYRITGLASSPLYLDEERGTSSLGDGSVTAFLYIPKSGFKADYYTSIVVTAKNSGRYSLYSDSYNNYIDRIDGRVKSAGKDAASSRLDRIQADAEEKLDKKEKKLKRAEKRIQNSESKLDENEAEIESGKNQLDQASAKITQSEKEIRSGKAKLQNALAALDQNETKLQSALAGPAAADPTVKAQLQAKLQKVRENRNSLQTKLATLNSNQKKLDAEKKKVATERSSLRAAEARLVSARETLSKSRARITSAKKKLAKARTKIRRMKPGKVYVQNRKANRSYTVYYSSADILNQIAKIFPLFFFLIAALVCVTTMTRMVHDGRTQNGVLKALGYSGSAIRRKYLFYAGSAGLIGSLAGFFAGCRIFPTIIWHAYTMLYTFTDQIGFIFDARLFVLTIAAALLCSAGAAWASSSVDLRSMPASLMIPRAPRPGKRILLERIRPLWNRISFLYKVSLRNTFRYRGRFFMMLLGIAGCTALLVAGFGINTSIKGVSDLQYKGVSTYDSQITFDRNMTSSRQEEFRDFSDGHYQSIKFLHADSAVCLAGSDEQDITLYSSDNKNFGRFLHLKSDGKTLRLPESGVIICRQISTENDIHVGDKVRIRENGKTRSVTVRGICDYYIGAACFMSDTAYREAFGSSPKINTALVRAPSGSTTKEIRRDAAKMSDYHYTAAVTVTQSLIDSMDRMMESLNAVVILIILCAGILAFIVLLNLTNMNITERLREIATIKVLGFRPGETAAYVYRENFIMTAAGVLVGLPLGYLLLRYVIQMIRAASFYFVLRITTLDYLCSALITFVFTAIVCIFLYRKLAKIDMTESLKSVD